MINPKYERRIRRAIFFAFVLCLCAALPPLFSLISSFRPQAEEPGQWFERSGAVMTVFAVYAQFKAGNIATMIAGGTFAESWEVYHKYKRYQAAAATLSLVLVVIGTAVWGYGDLLFTGHQAGRTSQGGEAISIGWPAGLTVYKLFTDWGSLIGGVFALVAGGVAYIAGYMQASATRQAAKMQVEAVRQSDEREVAALRKSLATEMRQLVARSLGAHNSLRNLITKANGPISARMIESSSRVPMAVIYPGSAPKIGLLGGSDAMDVVIVYSLIEIGREGAAEVLRSRTPDDIAPLNVAAVAAAFLEACKYAREVLPKLKTGVALHDDKDTALIATINDTASGWEALMMSWPKAS